MTPTVKVVCDTRFKKLDGRYALKLRVTFRRKQKYYGIEISVNRNKFPGIVTVSGRQVDIGLIEKLGELIIQKLPQFTFSDFEKIWKATYKTVTCPYFHLDIVSRAIRNYELEPVVKNVKRQTVKGRYIWLSKAERERRLKLIKQMERRETS